MKYEKHLRAILDNIPFEPQRTCSIFTLKSNSITFARHTGYIGLPPNVKNVLILVEQKTYDAYIKVKNISKGLFLMPVNSLDFTFALIHNYLNRNKAHANNEISEQALIDPSVKLGLDGFKYIKAPDGDYIKIKHMGNIIIEDGVEIAADSIVHRATIDSTIIKRNTKIGVKCNIGHNVIIGEKTRIAPCVTIGGSSSIGNNCLIGMGSIVLTNIIISNNIYLGAGAVVTNNLRILGGVYYGNPARYQGQYQKEWTF